MPIQSKIIHFKHKTFDKAQKQKKHIVRVSDKQFEKGDPNFVDERVPAHKLYPEKSFLSSLFEGNDEELEE